MNLEAMRILTEGSQPDGTDCTTVATEYGGGNAIEGETGLFLYGLVRRYKPANILETGTHWGYSSAWLALAMKDNWETYPNQHPGAVVTLDMSTYDGKPQRLWERVGVDHLIFSRTANSEDPNSYKDIQPDGVFGMFYMDADHAAEAIVKEFNGALRLLNRQRCLLVFHDTRLDERMDKGIGALLRQLGQMRSVKSGWDNIQHFAMRNMRGLDMILLTNGEYGY